MHIPTGVEMLPESVLQQLAPGEVALCAELATQLSGHQAIGGTTPPRANVSIHPLDALLGGTAIYVDPDWQQAVLGGVNATGALGSAGDLLSRALGGGAGNTLLLTNRRLAVVNGIAGLPTGPGDQHLIFSVDLRAVTGMQRKRRLLQWGRVRISFADGSWAMAMMGMLSGRPAERMVRAFDAAKS